MTEAIRFTSIRIRGYRGRNFDLLIPDGEKHFVFVMDGSTGKTTTIELLRWCFKYKESEAKGKFRHMWAIRAHVLDHVLTGKQTCTIQVEFVDDSASHYKFERKTIGSYDKSRGMDDSSGDEISSIKDTLEINRGEKILQGDKVNEFLSSRFGLRKSAEYFCFDGEKAREMMLMATSQAQQLVDLIKERTTHTQLQEYLEVLEELRDKLLFETNATLTERAQKVLQGKLRQLKTEQLEAKESINDLEISLQAYRQDLTDLTAEVGHLSERIRDGRSENLRRQMELDLRAREVRDEIGRAREQVYKSCRVWMGLQTFELVNTTKDLIRERGKLPEPYHRDLITACLEDPPTCQICGRPLDEQSALRRVQQLGKLIASHECQKFLTAKIVLEGIDFDVQESRKSIQDLVKQIGKIEGEYKTLTLDTTDTALIREKSEKDILVAENQRKTGEIDSEIKTQRKILEDIDYDLKDLYQKNREFEENKPLLEKIDELREKLEESREAIRKRAIRVISDVVSEAVANILGDHFSAKLDEQHGLMLGEDGFYSPEIGGYSGRLILSYLFAESMNQIGPIIIDTPVGNVGSHRVALAKHLASNHNQVVLLCLPSELQSFAEYFSDNPCTIVNGKSEVHD